LANETYIKYKGIGLIASFWGMWRSKLVLVGSFLWFWEKPVGIECIQFGHPDDRVVSIGWSRKKMV